VHPSSRWSEPVWYSARGRVEDVESPAPYASEEQQTRSPSPPVSPGHDLPPVVIGPDGQEWVREGWMRRQEGGMVGRRRMPEEHEHMVPRVLGRSSSRWTWISVQRLRVGRQRHGGRLIFFFSSTHTHTHKHT
jgi:hypothetical protein